MRSVLGYISSINNNDASCSVRVAYVSKYCVFTGKEVNAMLRKNMLISSAYDKLRISHTIKLEKQRSSNAKFKFIILNGI